MTAHTDMFSGMDAMSLAQLLSAFVACIGYALAQGGMLGSRGRLIALVAMVLGVGAFALQGTDWVRTVVLTAFAIVGFGSFVATVWLTSRMLGIDRAPSGILDSPVARVPNDAPSDVSPTASSPARPRISRPVAST
jgi:hypothetical protein